MRVAGTVLDRRAKVSKEDRKYIIKLYDSGLYTQAQLAEMFNVRPLQIWRYLNYRYYLDRAKSDNNKYYHSHKNTKEFKERLKLSKFIKRCYMDYLYAAKEEFKDDKEHLVKVFYLTNSKEIN